MPLPWDFLPLLPLPAVQAFQHFYHFFLATRHGPKTSFIHGLQCCILSSIPKSNCAFFSLVSWHLWPSTSRAWPQGDSPGPRQDMLASHVATLAHCPSLHQAQLGFCQVMLWLNLGKCLVAGRWVGTAPRAACSLIGGGVGNLYLIFPCLRVRGGRYGSSSS